MSLAIGAGIALGLEKAVNNIQSIQLARAKMEDEKKRSDIDYKIKTLELQKLEDEDPETAKMGQELLKKQYKMINSIYDVKLGISDAAKKGEQEKVKIGQAQLGILTKGMNLKDWGIEDNGTSMRDVESDIIENAPTPEEGYESIYKMRRGGEEDYNFGGEPAANPAMAPARAPAMPQKIRVKLRSTGQIGNIPADKFDESLFERL